MLSDSLSEQHDRRLLALVWCRMRRGVGAVDMRYVPHRPDTQPKHRK
ncbi:Uncharacterised protein [Mycobacteroides abscessus subsp. bolletii]|nr:Uncharacterised protein [Mycobacteroides abscessus subsp. bolletii]SHT34030.1 Uncharacterised protein [Mycobacteroides abscessus subsp. bolletii]SHT52212.1 Uncharacterised protein [Mycobacteroides abscessus subsp. bolletii]SKG65560.1 Uncharacterised protein [Mycobacteroides abscessus subsp. bolletii]SKH20610.1 Uncharacterised protein [Mycobacteroides abscessus subsp. bolletii]